MATSSTNNNNNVLNFIHAFGLKGNVKNNVCYIDETTLAYPCGHNIIVYNSDSKEQQVIAGMETGVSDGITAIAITPNCRYLAVAEKGEKPCVNMWDLGTMRRRKCLTYADLGSTQYNNLAFSADGKLCLTLGGAPDWSLILWGWEKAKVLATFKCSNQYGSEVYQADFCPQDTTTVCVTGNGIIRFLKVFDGQFRPQPLTLKREPPHFLCHAWVNQDRVVAAASNGEIWLFENFEFKLVLSCSPENEEYITSIATYSKGFVCGGNDGILRIYEKSEDAREYYRTLKIFKIMSNPYNITNMTISPSEDNLTCSLENSQIYSLNLSNTDILKEDAMNFELLATPFHAPGNEGSHITGLDVCSRKPLIVTCGYDRTVRVWNYLDKTMDSMKTFPEVAHSVAFHPSGLHILVGFSDKLRLMNLLMDDIRVVKEMSIKSCKEVKFSHGGQYYAAVNNNAIQVYNTYSTELIVSLRGHSNPVSAIAWKADDKYIISCSADGYLFTWKVSTGYKLNETSLRCRFKDIALSGELEAILVSASDQSLKELDLASGAIREQTGPTCAFGPITYSPIHKTLFAGTVDPALPGALWAFKLPLGPNRSSQCGFFQAHELPVTRIRTSPDGQYLFSTGEDGSLCIFEIKDGNNKYLRRDRDATLQFAEEILITKSDLEQKTSIIQNYNNQVEDLQLHNEYQLRTKDMNYKEKIKEVTEKFNSELLHDRERYEELQQDKQDMELHYEEKMQELERKRADEIAELQKTYEQKIAAEVDRCHQLRRERDEQDAKWEEENQMLVETQTRFLAEMTSDYDSKVEQEQSLQTKLANEKDQMINAFEELKNQIEEDADMEIRDLKQTFDSKLQAERASTLRLKGENAIMKKKFGALQKDIEDQREEIRSLQDKEKELFEKIKALEKDIHGHKKEIREREETIQDKEKRIYDLKKKNQELEKFKFVLDYKIKELKRQIEPRENEIQDMHKQIEEMDLELEQYHRSNAALDLMIGELRLKMEGMQREINRQTQFLAQGEQLVKRFQADINGCTRHLDDNKNLKNQIVAIYKRYVQEQNSKTSGIESNLQSENNRQREFLEKTVESLKRKIAKDTQIHMIESNRLMRENVSLTDESNRLRREYHSVLIEEKTLLADAHTSDNQSISPQYQKVIKKQHQDISTLEKHLKYLRSLCSGPVAPMTKDAIPKPILKPTPPSGERLPNINARPR